jgi:hypothetical protein
MIVAHFAHETQLHDNIRAVDTSSSLDIRRRRERADANVTEQTVASSTHASTLYPMQ